MAEPVHKFMGEYPLNSHMVIGRRFAGHVYRGLKTLTGSVYHDVFGSSRAAAERTCVSASTLEKYADPSEPRIIRMDVAMDLDAAANEPNFLGYMADALGFDISRRDETHILMDVNELNSQTVKELSAVLMTLAKALEDGKITPNEAKEILAKNHTAKAIIRALDTFCHVTVARAEA